MTTQIKTKNPNLSPKEILSKKVNKKLEGTGYTYELLESTYGDDHICAGITTIEGDSVWFNKSYMKVFKRTEEDFFSINYIKTLEKLNKDHPFTEIFIENFKNKTKQFRGLLMKN